MADESIPLKRCLQKSKCIHPDTQDGWMPANNQYFPKARNRSDGLYPTCKRCKCLEAKRERDDPIQGERVKIRSRANYHKHRVARCERHREWWQENLETLREKKRQYNQEHSNENVARVKQWAIANPERAKLNASVNTQRRNARKRGLPNEFQPSDWLRCLDYFNHCCAVCQRPLNGLFHVAAMDHWIPLSHPECKGTVRTNIIPLCHGLGGCNNRKSTHLPELWLQEQFGKKRAKDILKHIQDYFEWVERE